MIHRCVLRMVLLLLVVLGWAWPVTAAISPGMIVRDIEIRGQRRTPEATIRFYVKTEVGKPYAPQTLSEDIKRLYALRMFDDIQVLAEEVADGLRLVFTVVEKPAVRSITFTGNRYIESAEVTKRLLLKERATFARNLLNDTVLALHKHYREEGYYFAHVRPEVTDVADNQVDIVLRITEGSKVYISRIRFTGNKGLTDGELRKEVQLKEYTIPVLSGPSALYKPETLRIDLQLLENVYQNNGYINVQVGEPVVEINREAGGIIITVPITREGEQFKIGKVTLVGDHVFTEEELRQKVRLTTGEIYSREAVRRDILGLTDAYADRGYAFADVAPTVSIDQATRLVHLSLTTRPGPKVYIGRIDIVGNERTRDQVIRRELRLDEGDLYSATKLQRSKQRLTNLQYFEEVKIDTRRRGEEELLDLQVEVAERSTGQFTAGVGFSSAESVVFTGSISQSNLFGRGQTVSLSARLGSLSQDFTLEFQEPYLFGLPINAGVSVFRRSSDFQTFTSRRTGTGLTLGRALGEYARTSVTYNYEVLQISNLDPGASDVLRQDEGTSYTSSLTPRIVWDSRDNQFDPARGSLHSFEVTGAGLGGTNRFYKINASTTWYFPLPEGLTGFVRGRFGVGEGYGGKNLPAAERFFLGGATSVRGFNFRDIGPQDARGNPLGGTSYVQFNVEIGRSLGRLLRVVTFFDAGNVYVPGNQFNFGDVRRSAGVGFRLITPVGPIRLDYGFKLDRRRGESMGALGFLLGTF